MGKAKNVVLDGEAVSVKDMELTKAAAGAPPLKFECFRCDASKQGAVKASWKTSQGLKTVCQGCAGQLHRIATEGGDVSSKKKQETDEVAAGPPAGCCEACNTVLFAAGLGHLECVRGWLKSGADANFAGRKKIERPLHKAAANGYVEVARLLLDSGAELDALDKQRRTAVYRAAESGKADVVELLLERGADSSVECDVKKKATALQVASASLKRKRSHMAKDDDEKQAAAKRAVNRQRTVDLLTKASSDAAPEEEQVEKATKSKKAKPLAAAVAAAKKQGSSNKKQRDEEDDDEEQPAAAAAAAEEKPVKRAKKTTTPKRAAAADSKESPSSSKKKKPKSPAASS